MAKPTQNWKDSGLRNQSLIFVIGLAVLACLMFAAEIGSYSSSQKIKCEKCPMDEDDLKELFSGSKMAGFSQYSEKGVIKDKAVVPEREHSSFESNSVQDAADLPQGGGSFDIAVVKDPSEIDEKTDRRLGFGLRSTEWSSLFFQVLGCPPAEPYVVGEDIDVWTENRKNSFQAAIPDYPLLARMWDPFKRIWYSPGEIAALKLECQAVSRKYPTNAFSSSGLQKLETACDEALKDGLGLLLISD